MKKHFYLFALLFIAASTVKATVLTVSNDSKKPASYTSINSAMSAAKNGDTLFVLGTNTSYGNVAVKKHLTLIGQGHHPVNVNVSATTVDYIDFYTDSVTIIGFYVNQNINYNSKVKASNIDIERCYVTYSISINDSSANWLIADNFIFDLSGPSSSAVGSVLILNNVFFRYSVNGFVGNVSIKNNLFLNTSSLSYLTNATISNNIFYGTAAVTSTVDKSSFKNNITLKTPGSGASAVDSIPNGTNTGSGNFISKDPSFLKIDPNNRYDEFSVNNDYHLKSNSVGHNAGTDGTDVGPFGGSKPLNSYGGDPALPLITEFDIVNDVVPQGGTLNFTIKAKKQQ
jgi:hypothetical protein